MVKRAPTAARPAPVSGEASSAPVDAVASAKAAGLRYVTDARPGIRRRRSGAGFTYVAPDGGRLTDPDDLARIKALAIPPAWTDVWICPDARGHLQATGRDARGRKQYRYHPEWRRARDETKYERMVQFGEALPRIRARAAADLGLPGLPREKVVATVVRLLDRTMLRVGNDEYARANGSYGLTTLRNRHVEVAGSTVRFEFKGKSGKTHSVDLRDERLARIVKRCRDLPGQELFQCVDEQGERRSVDSADVNEYLREITGEDFTAKDFRTWAGTVLAARALNHLGTFRSQRQAKRNVVRAIEAVAAFLGNTPAVCRKCYVHPGVLDAYLEGFLLERCRLRAPARAASKWSDRLRPDERAVLTFLRALARERKRARRRAA